MYVTERFHLDAAFTQELQRRPIPWGFGLFSEVVYYRTYSRAKEDGSQEAWADTVVRVVEGAMSLRKDWYKKMGIRWDHSLWQGLAQEMAIAIFEIKFLPPGRGLWAMGTEYIYERGSAALNNCGFVDVTNDLGSAASWAMDMLMCGVGVGFSTQNAKLRSPHRPGAIVQTMTIPDSREGWVASVKALIDSYYGHEMMPNVTFDYSQIRPAGLPLKGFGGISSGPDPLKKLHNRLREFLDAAVYNHGSYPQTRLIADTMNAIGACVVAGNIRRSAQLATGRVSDFTFLHLKDYAMYPMRRDIGWMSNNSVVLAESPEFEQLPIIADRIRDNGEPGVINLINMQKYARYGKKKPDAAIGFNPCAEIPLEDRELCNVVEVFPTRCTGVTEVWRMMKLATIYAHSVSLLPSHDETTNAVMLRNRRIGVSVSGVADWIDLTSLSHVTMALRRGYEEHVEPTNIALARGAGVPASVRLTTVKPSGTISQLAGVSPGMHWPVFRYGIRRIRISANSPLAALLVDANVPVETDSYSDNTLCFSFPLESGKGKTRSVSEVSIWEQASLVAMLQREWADNAVSNTLTFRPEEAGQIERVIAAHAPLVKSMSLLPDIEESQAYAQPPYEKTSQASYRELTRSIHEINWEMLRGVDGIDPQFCANDQCDLPVVS